MRITTIAMLGMLVTALGGCLSESEDVRPPDEEALVADDEALVADDEASVELGSTTSEVVAGCSANINCTGNKTCGAWSAWSTCGASYQRCDANCGFITRWGCTAQATVSPQNRSRSCVMRATGATCVEVDYREVMISCPAG